MRSVVALCLFAVIVALPGCEAMLEKKAGASDEVQIITESGARGLSHQDISVALGIAEAKGIKYLTVVPGSKSPPGQDPLFHENWRDSTLVYLGRGSFKIFAGTFLSNESASQFFVSDRYKDDLIVLAESQRVAKEREEQSKRQKYINENTGAPLDRRVALLLKDSESMSSDDLLAINVAAGNPSLMQAFGASKNYNWKKLFLKGSGGGVFPRTITIYAVYIGWTDGEVPTPEVFGYIQYSDKGSISLSIKRWGLEDYRLWDGYYGDHFKLI